jgi:hypothetical protein
MIVRILAILFLLVSSVAHSAITDGKFGINQIFDVQYYWSGTTLNASNFIAPYDKNFQTVTVTSGQYFQFFASTTNPGKYGLGLYNSNGTLAKVVHDYGDITALGSGAIFYIGSGFFGNVISTAQGYSYGASATFTNMDTSVSSTDLSNYTWASTTPLASGQTAAPAGPPPPAPTAIYNTSSTVYITNHYPTSNNSPAGEGAANAFDNNPNTKYLNFDKKNAGVTIKLNQGRVVTGFTLTTANDFSGRDPTSYKLYGSNDGANWTLIQDGTLSLSESRYWTSSTIPVTNSTAYVYYYIFFPTTKAGDGCGLNCNSMQIAEITYFYDANNTTTSTATGTSVSNPGSYCCGGGESPFNANASFSSRVQTFTNRTTADNQVYIEQIGNSNTITVQQSGTRNNYVNYYGNGSSNTVTITQIGNASTTANYIELDLGTQTVSANLNTVNLQQNSTGGSKRILATVTGNSNTLLIQQKDSGNHYAEVNLTGGNKSVDLTQQGSAGHMANIGLHGNSTSLTLTQSGSTQQFYSINHTCTTAGGCAAITVTQGQ